MLHHGDSVTVALSGGADSVALFLALIEIASEYNLTLAACHVNHHLRGAESDGDCDFCKELCEKLNIPLTIFDVDVLSYCKLNKVSTELGARELRYQCFEQITCNGMKLATAHTLSDSVETTIFHLTRGTSIDGMCGIAPVRDQIIRPLSFVTRQEIIAYLDHRNQPYVTDSTNADERYSRNFIRNTVIPSLKTLNPSLEDTIQRMLLQNREDTAYLLEQAEALLSSASRGEKLDANILLAAPQSLKSRALILWLKRHSLPYDNRRVELLCELLANEGAVSITATHRVSQQNNLLEILSETCKQMDEYTVRVGSDSVINLQFREKILKITSLKGQEIKFFVNKNEKQFKNCLDCDKLNELLTARTRRDGDRFAPAGRGCTKSLKKLMNEAKMPQSQRMNALLLYDGDVVWLEGFGASERAAVTADTKNAIHIEIIWEDNHNA